MRTKNRLYGAAFGALFMLATFVFIAADDAQAQGTGGFSRSGTASSGSFALVQKQQVRQFQQNMKQEKSQMDQQNRQFQQNIKQDKRQMGQQNRQFQQNTEQQKMLMEQHNRQFQQNIEQEKWQKEQQALPEYVSDYDDYQQ